LATMMMTMEMMRPKVCDPILENRSRIEETLLRIPTPSSDDLKLAASTISPESLKEARGAIEARSCKFLTKLDILERGLDKVRTFQDAKKFSCALAMYQLAYLPTKPETCPFCVQHSGGNRCEGCGYAKTHGGRCDKDTSAFAQFIEAIYDLAGAIHSIQDEGENKGADPLDLDLAKKSLQESIYTSREATMRFISDISNDSTYELMETKARYIGEILQAMPLELMNSKDAKLAHLRSYEKLERYW